MDMGKIMQSSSSNSDPDISGLSEIAEFFNGCNVLLTGGSGFVGRLLIEKLLRSCPKIKKLYIILREKKNRLPEERYEELFEDALFHRLKGEQTDFRSKIVMIEGEFNDSGFELSPENRKLIKDSHIVFHGAATVRFDDKLRFAVNINVRGTKEVLLLCRQMPNLKAIVHIGTAFSQCINKFIDEVFYEPPIDCDTILELLDRLNDEQLDALTPTLVGKWPNTYAFTKSIAENTVLKYSKGLPVCIVRPSIMIPTDEDPIPGWINNLYGATGVVVGASIGLIHSLHANSKNVADIIPADYVINNIVASAWDVGTMRVQHMQETVPATQDSEENVAPHPPIYNSVTSIQNPITWGEYMEYSEIHGFTVPTVFTVWYYCLTLNKHLWLHNIYIFFFDIIPAIIIDTLAWITGRKPMLLSTYKKIHKFSGVISYFCMRQWKFRNDNVLKLWDKMSPIDQKLFYFHVKKLRWKEYFYYHARGVRLYLIKDGPSSLEAGQKRFARLKIVHYSVGTIFSLLLLWLVYAVMSRLYAFIVY